MFELREEETLMSSSDNSVKLTSHRIIHESEQGRRQIMLEDFESIQLKRSSIGAYGILLLIFVSITLGSIYMKITNYYDGQYLNKSVGISLFDAFWEDKAFIVLLFVLMVLHFFYLISRRNTIIIIGKYNSIEFRVKNFKAASVQKMLNKLVEQSNKRKNLK
jgi:hypothetical protein